MATPHRAELDELLPIYALGALDGEDVRLLEAHIAAGCPECERRLAELRNDLELLAASLPPQIPSETVRARVLRALPATAPPADRSHWSRWLPVAAALALLVWGLWGRADSRRVIELLSNDRDRLARQAAALDQQLAAARQENARLERAMQVISAPGMQPVALAGLGSLPEAKGRTFVDPSSGQAVFVASNLPKTEPGKTYQLWFIAEGRPVSAGIFEASPDGTARLAVADVAPIEEIQAWAVTIEPAGGVPQPTGEMVLKG